MHLLTIARAKWRPSVDTPAATRSPPRSWSRATTAVAERVPRDLAAEARVVAYADAMTREVRVPDELFDALRADFDETELVELTATVAVHNMVSRFLVALEIDPEK